MGRKRKSGTGTVRLRKDGRWEGRIVIGYDEKGLPKTKNVLAKTKGECLEKLTALKAAVEKPVPGKAKSEMPFGEWIEFWYQTYKKANVRPNTQRGYERMIRTYIQPRIGQIPLNKLTTNDIQQFYVWMKTDGRIEYREIHGNGLADTQICNCHSLCRWSLEKAVEEGLIPRNPALDCKLPSIKRREMRILSREEIQRLLIQAKEERYYEVFLLELATGLRLGELAALQWDDLNFKTGELRISKQVSKIAREMVISEPKTKSGIRTLILPPPVLAALEQYKSTVDSRWMFPSPRKEHVPIDPSVIRQRLYKLLDHAECKRVRFHDLRHLFATNALANGMDVKTLSTVIGHASSSTTLNVYSHVTDAMRKSAAVKIDRGIAGVEAPDDESKAEERTMTTFKARKRWQRRAK